MKPAALLILLFLSCPACLMADNAALAARAREQVAVLRPDADSKRPKSN